MFLYLLAQMSGEYEERGRASGQIRFRIPIARPEKLEIKGIDVAFRDDQRTSKQQDFLIREVFDFLG